MWTRYYWALRHWTRYHWARLIVDVDRPPVEICNTSVESLTAARTVTAITAARSVVSLATDRYVEPYCP